MKICIICRENKEEFNDEHVIPDSIDGFYHIYTVCVDCNSKMGKLIDNKLTNHKFIEFQRDLYGIKGKSRTVPNPFSGTHTLKNDPEQKLHVILDEEGKYNIKLIPKIIPGQEVTDKFTIVLDKQDALKADEILDKFLKRNGIPKEKIKSEILHKKIEEPWVHILLKIDVRDFKLAILKIAYEFAVDQLPAYFNDPIAIEISKILFDADFDALNNKVTMIGDGMNKQILQPFDHLIDFENNNHYLILFDSEDLGLICFVNLFNVFSLGFVLSKQAGFIKDNLLVGKNDFLKRDFNVYNLSQVISQTYTPIRYRFKYFLPDDTILLNEFLANDRDENFSFFTENNGTPLFYKNGQIAYADIQNKINQPQLQHIAKGDEKKELVTEMILDEELFIKLLPINKLYKVISVQIEQYKRSRL